MRKLSVILLLFVFENSFAQNLKDTIVLKETEIKADYRNEKQWGIQLIDSSVCASEKNSTLADLLTKYSTLHVKNYGQGNIATLTYRGTSASQNQIRWNGINLNSAMLGQSDLSLVPVLLAERVEILQGTQTAHRNVGAIGATVMFNNAPVFSKNNTVGLLSSVGSFGTYANAVNASIASEKTYAALLVYNNTSKNNFPYRNNAVASSNFPLEYRSDAQYWTQGVQLNAALKIKKSLTVSLSGWGQEGHRNIPGSLVAPNPQGGNEAMKSNFYAAVAKISYSDEANHVNLQLFYKKDRLIYSNRLAQLESDNTVQTPGYEAEIARFFRNAKLFLLIEGIQETAITANYEMPETSRPTHTLIVGNESRFGKRIKTKLSINNLYSQQQQEFFLPSANVEYLVLPKMDLRLNCGYSLNVRQPTLNDLYWKPGGNPDLKQEEARTFEAGIRQGYSKTGIHNHFSAVYFNTQTKNWIGWQPDPALSYWTAQNLKQVVSQGIELNENFRFSENQWSFECISNVVFTNAFENKQNELVSGKKNQLIYIPDMAANLHFSFSIRGITFGYSVLYTGKRYTSFDNKRYLPAYTLNDARVEYRFKMLKSNWALQFKINNIWDIDYHVIAWQPMPGRSFNATLNYKFETRK